jgi:hypothetical protein
MIFFAQKYFVSCPSSVLDNDFVVILLLRMFFLGNLNGGNVIREGNTRGLGMKCDGWIKGIERPRYVNVAMMIHGIVEFAARPSLV